MIRRLSIILVSVLSLCLSMMGQDLSVQSSIDKSEMLTGHQANITLNIRTNDLSRTSYAITNTQEPERFRILSYTPKDTVDIDEEIKEFKVDVLLTSFDSTLITIPPFVVSNGVDSVFTKPLTLKVKQPVVDISKPENIAAEKDFWSVSLGFKDYLYIVLHSWIFYTVLAIILIVLLGFYLYKRSLRPKDEKIVVKQEIILTPLQKAQRDFSSLDKRDYLIKADYKSYYTECFDIVRRYIEDKRGWDVLEMTSEELLDTFNNDESANVLSPKLKDLTRECDFVKFAKFTPSRDKADRFRKDSYLWIEEAEDIFSINEKTVDSQDDKEKEVLS